MNILKFIYSEKATNFLRNLHLFLTGTTTSQKKRWRFRKIFVAFSEYMNFTSSSSEAISSSTASSSNSASSSSASDSSTFSSSSEDKMTTSSSSPKIYYCYIILFFFIFKNISSHSYSTFVNPVKMKYGLNSIIFGLKMMMKSGLEKIFLKSQDAKSLFQKIFIFIEWWIVAQNYKFSNKNDSAHGGDFKEKKILCRDKWNFKQKISPIAYSIFTGWTMIELVGNCVLNHGFLNRWMVH